jgi:hypothetical protein
MEGFTGPNGAMDCAKYFQGNVGASAHWCIDNFHPNQVVCGVYEQYAAWTQSGMNNVSFGVEQAGYASTSRDTWLNQQGTLLTTTAALVRQICDKYQIPIRSLNSSEAQDTWTKGVCDHVDFGSKGGGHWDCGEGYPMDKIIEWAKAGASVPQPVGGDMTASTAYDPNGNAHHVCLGESDGSIYYWPPGWSAWGQIDKTQKNARSGVGIAISKDWWVTLTYVNASGNVCTYHKQFNSDDPWVFTNKGGSARLQEGISWKQ